MDCYYHFDYLQWGILYWVIQLKGQNCPLKIRSFGSLSLITSFSSAFISFLFFLQCVFSVLCPFFQSLSLLLFHTLPPFLSWLGRHECGRQMAGMFHVSEGSCLSHSPLSLSLPGGQQGGLKSNWQLAERELTQGLFRAALIDNCK